MLESQVPDLRLVIHVFDLTLKSTAIETFPGVIEDLDYEYKNHQIWDFFCLQKSNQSKIRFLLMVTSLRKTCLRHDVEFPVHYFD